MTSFDRMWEGSTPRDGRSGRESCLQPGCARQVSIRCVYADRRQRLCATTWCLEHGAMFDDTAYCRRHARTVAALSNGFYQLALPDLENRAPSLVGWMSEELDAPIRAALRASEGSNHARVVTDPVRLTCSAGGSPPRCWSRAWKLVDHLGVVRQVSIEVEEGAQDIVALRVDGDLVGRSTPPWIERRRSVGAVSPEGDATSRNAFNLELAGSVQAFLDRDRAASAL